MPFRRISRGRLWLLCCVAPPETRFYLHKRFLAPLETRFYLHKPFLATRLHLILSTQTFLATRLHLILSTQTFSRNASAPDSIYTNFSRNSFALDSYYTDFLRQRRTVTRNATRNSLLCTSTLQTPGKAYPAARLCMVVQLQCSAYNVSQLQCNVSVISV